MTWALVTFQPQQAAVERERGRWRSWVHRPLFIYLYLYCLTFFALFFPFLSLSLLFCCCCSHFWSISPFLFSLRCSGNVCLTISSLWFNLFVSLFLFFLLLLLPSFISSSRTMPLAVYKDADSSRSVSCRYPSPLPAALFSFSFTFCSFFIYRSPFFFSSWLICLFPAWELNPECVWVHGWGCYQVWNGPSFTSKRVACMNRDVY